jgi:hypothetical protein
MLRMCTAPGEGGGGMGGDESHSYRLAPYSRVLVLEGGGGRKSETSQVHERCQRPNCSEIFVASLVYAVINAGTSGAL